MHVMSLPHTVQVVGMVWDRMAIVCCRKVMICFMIFAPFALYHLALSHQATVIACP